MGFLSWGKKVTDEELVAIGTLAGFGLGCAVARVAKGEPFETVVYCDSPDGPRIFYLDARELAQWREKNAAQYPSRYECVATKSKGMPALAVTAISATPAIQLRFTARYFPSSAPNGFELETIDFDLTGIEGKARLLAAVVAKGLKMNQAAMEAISPPMDLEKAAAHDKLISVSARELAEKLLSWPGTEPRFSQDTQQFAVLDAAGRVRVRGRFQAVGTYSTETGSWLWAWANPSLDSALVEEVKKIRAWGREERLEPFGEPRTVCSLQVAERLFGVALHLMKAPAWCRSTISPTSVLYVALYDIETIAPGVTN
jgi:hypothetical protein